MASEIYKLVLGEKAMFETKEPSALAQHMVERFPPEGDLPSPNLMVNGWAIVLPDETRLIGLRAGKWVRQNKGRFE